LHRIKKIKSLQKTIFKNLFMRHSLRVLGYTFCRSN
jgi:hypothetical protein